MDNVLWKKILDFDLNGTISEYPFSVRLSLENGWTRSFAQDAIVEYKKFMYLAATSREMVSPSGIVDIVWHEHLVFTKSYSDFCELIGRRIEHVPATGRPGEHEKFEQAKKYTVSAYESAFGKQPRSHWDFDQMTDQLELPKARLSIDRFALYGIFAFLILHIPMYLLLLPVYARLESSMFFTASLLLFAMAFAGLQFYNAGRLQAFFAGLHRKSFLFELSPVELIYAKTGNLAHVIHSSVSRLVREDRLSIDGAQRISLGANDSPTSNPITYTIVNCVRNHDGTTYKSLVGLLMMKPAIKAVAAPVNATFRYFRKSRFVYCIFALNFTMLTAIYLFVSVRLLTGLTRGKPVLYLVLLMIVLAVAICFVLWTLVNAPIRKYLVSHYLKEYKNSRNTKLDYDRHYFIMGDAALLPIFLPVYQQFDRNPGNSGSTCGSSCGSSCSAGGCGGCGGGD